MTLAPRQLLLCLEKVRADALSTAPPLTLRSLFAHVCPEMCSSVTRYRPERKTLPKRYMRLRVGPLFFLVLPNYRLQRIEKGLCSRQFAEPFLS